MTDDFQLLRRYVESGSEEAFAQLVERYLDLVYSAALRQVGGDAQLAQDVVQTVFAALSRKARGFANHTVLGGWLYRHTSFVAKQTLRTERRRRVREQQAVQMNAANADTEPAWEHLAPFLDDAMGQLGGRDRDAIVLRYFERLDMRGVGAALGTSEEAAKKRVLRAVEKLRSLFKRRGLTLTGASLASLLAAHAVTAAPVGVAAIVTGAGLTGAATTGAGNTYLLLKLMTSTKLKAGIIGVLVVASVATPLVIQHQVQSILRDENRSLRQQVEQLTRLKAENARLSNLLAQEENSQSLSKDQWGELYRLRGEVGGLRRQQKELEKLLAARGAQNLQTAATPQEAVEKDTIPKDSWSFVGYATPEAALQSVAWAMSKGDVKTFLASLTPEAQKSYAEEFVGKSENEITAMLSHEISGIAALRLDRKKTSTESEVTFVVFSAGQDNGEVKTHDEAIMKFKNMGREWKFAANE